MTNTKYPPLIDPELGRCPEPDCDLKEGKSRLNFLNINKKKHFSD